MSKLLSVIVAALFAVGSVSAFAASHAGAQMKDDKKGKAEAKKGEPKKAEPKKADAKKTDGKKKADEKKK